MGSVLVAIGLLLQVLAMMSQNGITLAIFGLSLVVIAATMEITQRLPSPPAPAAKSRRVHVDEVAPTPGDGVSPVVPAAGQRPGESAEAWAKRVQDDEVAAFKARRKG